MTQAPTLARSVSSPPCCVAAFAALGLLAACATARPLSEGRLASSEGRWAALAPLPPASEEQPNGLFELRVAPGTAEIDIGSGTNITSDTDAFWFGLGFEGVGKVVGGGVQFAVYASDDDLLETSSAIDTSVSSVQLFPHLTIRPAGGPFRMPIRIGPEVFTHTLDVSSGTGSATLDWVSLGFAIEVEPEVDFFRTDRQALSVFGKLRGGAGAVYIESDLEEYSTDSSNFGIEIGLRWQITKFLMQLGFMSRDFSYAESEPEGSSFVEETDFTFEGVFLSIGARW